MTRPANQPHLDDTYRRTKGAYFCHKTDKNRMGVIQDYT